MTTTVEIWDGLPVTITKVSRNQLTGQWAPVEDQFEEVKRFKMKYYQFPKEVFDEITRTTHNAQMAVLACLYELWFTNFKKNPVELSSVGFRSFGISRASKMRALKALEESGLITIQMRNNRCPSVTLNWEDLKD
jgi:hypothetical protein